MIHNPSMQLAMKDREEHEREAARLKAIAATITTSAMRAQVLAMAREHARLAARVQKAAEGDGSEFCSERLT
jgi:hypothetical protein